MASSLGRRAPFVALALGTIAIGLAVHRAGWLGPVARDVAGDALWAVMIAWWIGALAPSVSLSARLIASFAICLFVELSQLVHTPALDALRDMPGGHLVLGRGFDSRDLAAYALGVVAAAVLEFAARHWLGGARDGATR